MAAQAKLMPSVPLCAILNANESRSVTRVWFIGGLEGQP